MKRFAFVVLLISIACSIWAQAEENLFEWQTNQAVAKEKFLKFHIDQSRKNRPTFVYKKLDVPTSGSDKYYVNITGVNKEMSEYGDYDMFEIYHNDKKILEHIPHALLYDVRYITRGKSNDYFIKVPLSDDSFALLFGGWLFGSGDETTEMIIVVVSKGHANVIFDDYAYAYKYTPGENFSIEFVDDINGLQDLFSFSESFLRTRTKHKIWREGNMLKYKSWK